MLEDIRDDSHDVVASAGLAPRLKAEASVRGENALLGESNNDLLAVAAPSFFSSGLLAGAPKRLVADTISEYTTIHRRCRTYLELGQPHHLSSQQASAHQTTM